MALKKSKEVKGYLAEYWKITAIRFDYINLSLQAEMCLFKDMQSRLAGDNNSMERIVRSWGIQNFYKGSTMTIPEMFMDFANKSMLEIVGMVYVKWVEPVMEDNLETGEQENTNWFSDAENVMEV
jgi:hypothetical protein